MDHLQPTGASPRPDLATLPLFRDLEPEDRLALAASCSTLQLDTGALLMDPTRDAHGLFVVLSGALSAGEPSNSRLVLVERGEIVADWAGVCCLPALQAVEPSEVLVIPWPAANAILRTRASLRQHVASDVARRALILRISSTPLFAGMDESAVSALAAACTFVTAARGDVIIREGDAPDAVFIVARGSLEVYRNNRQESAETVGLLGDGACVGEMGVLTKEPRSTSVRARRPSTLIRVPAAAFDRVLAHNAPTALMLARTLSGRLERTTRAAVVHSPASIIALVRSCSSEAFAEFCDGVGAAFAAAGHSVAALPRIESEESAGSDIENANRYTAWLETADETHDVVLCTCDDAGSIRAGASVRQADLILIVGELNSRPHSDVLSLIDAARPGGARLELALLRDPSTPPRGTGAWLDATRATAHHHVEVHNRSDYARVVRRMSGRGWGLVLGGGGARALAHIGVLRALREAGMPVDMVGGTSMGAILSAQYAMGCGAREMLAMSRRAYAGRSGPPDLTAPFVSVRSGRSTAGRLKSMFGERNIEDLPLSYFCVSCNLTKASVEFHDRGPVWLWTRASCSVPGLLPPIPRGGDVLVDGGLLNNLPVEEMRRRLRGSVVAADVSVAVDLTVNPELPSEPAWSGVGQLFRLASRRPRLPNIVEVLMRSAEIASVRDSRTAGAPADLYLHVPLEGYTMSDFAAIDEIVEAGYQYTVRRLEAWDGARSWQRG